jgi:hypothetical protein
MSAELQKTLTQTSSRLFIAIISVVLNAFAMFFIRNEYTYSKKFETTNKKPIGWLIGILSTIVLLHAIAIFQVSSLNNTTVFYLFEMLLAMYYLNYLLSKQNNPHPYCNSGKMNTFDKMKTILILAFQLYIIFFKLRTIYGIANKINRETKPQQKPQPQPMYQEMSNLNRMVADGQY